MIAILIRLPEELLAEIDELAEETHSNRSVFIRQACARHIHVLRAVELPAVRAYYTKLLPNSHKSEIDTGFPKISTLS